MNNDSNFFNIKIPSLENMVEPPSPGELDRRLDKFIEVMDRKEPGWDTAIIFGKVNQYYFTGTMQDGFLLVNSKGEKYYFVRKSPDRARLESPLKEIHGITSYRDAAKVYGRELGNTYMDLEKVSYAMVGKFSRHFEFNTPKPLDKYIFYIRAVKSEYELKWMKISGKLHNILLKEKVPSLLQRGMSEADLIAALFKEMTDLGYHGVSRFSMFETDMVIGQVGFGESSIYPTSFDGPGGNYGMGPAVPTMGRRDRFLKNGDLVFVDIGFGVNGYHSDKTQVYMFNGSIPYQALQAHEECMRIEERTASQLKAGNIPSRIYTDIMESLDKEFSKGFMGYNDRTVKFLGHGVGLHIDEYPVIAKGFNEPLEENMAIALEPKKGIPGFGMVGVEDTYVVSKTGGVCITGGGSRIMQIERTD